MTTGTDRFRRSDRIRRTRDFKRVARESERTASPYFVLLVAESADLRPEGESGGRVGLTVSRQVGNAVVRNRVKRSIREWYRRSGHKLPRLGVSDVVVIARPLARGLSGHRIAAELSDLSERIEVMA